MRDHKLKGQEISAVLVDNFGFVGETSSMTVLPKSYLPSSMFEKIHLHYLLAACKAFPLWSQG